MNITVYCGANHGKQSAYVHAARQLGTWIAQQGHCLVYGGGKAGLMGVLADEVLGHGGRVIGVIPDFLVDREVAHAGLSELHIVTDMSVRKQKMFDLGQAFIALPGGPGTLEELTEVFSWAILGKNAAPVIVYNVDNYYQPLQTMYQQMVHQGFLAADQCASLRFCDSLAALEACINDYRPPRVRSYD
ncbi:lysine decarboxylase [Aerococcus urinaehominis]|uniref:Cytokinin riboside 5'-monophosphate phosphoribohydrolase n=1 Tax=Aerococcus urinaehominis TaxID=128944 RepID=A0A0X8FLE3_9LACT|nr:TIGR00730 family Rossman fold protein [Aerococcus urinaehominis]AMB99229.1 lysine decarboxylase [Aerococcus urinaehominis]SDM31715.1 hypothetical protein SAMN04487985_11228 [Aerococcus urinaehominis]